MSDLERFIEKLCNDKAKCGAGHRGAKGLCCLSESAIFLRVIRVAEGRPDDAASYEGVVRSGVAIVCAGDESARGGVEDAVVSFVAFAHLVVAGILVK